MADRIGIAGLIVGVVALLFFVLGDWWWAGVFFVIATPLCVFACWKGKPMIEDY